MGHRPPAPDYGSWPPPPPIKPASGPDWETRALDWLRESFARNLLGLAELERRTEAVLVGDRAAVALPARPPGKPSRL